MHERGRKKGKIQQRLSLLSHSVLTIRMYEGLGFKKLRNSKKRLQGFSLICAKHFPYSFHTVSFLNQKGLKLNVMFFETAQKTDF